MTRTTTILGVGVLLFGLGCGGATTEPATTDATSPSASATTASTGDALPKTPPADGTAADPKASAACVDDCVKSRQMQAISIEQIKKNCEEECAKK